MKFEKLTDREVKAADMISIQAASTEKIAAALGIKKSNAVNVVNEVMRKTGMFSRLELMMNWNCELFQIGMRELGMR